MTAELSIEMDRRDLTLHVVGAFDFSLHDDFRLAQEQLQPPISRCIVDLAQATQIDSSALGILLVLQEQAFSIGARVVLANAPVNIRDVLAIGNFDELFDVAEPDFPPASDHNAL